MQIWAEWVCKRCQTLHRVHFEIVSSMSSPQQRKTMLFIKDDIFIEDSASSKTAKGRKIYVPYNTQIAKMLQVLRDYMYKFYAINNESLTLEVCNS